MTFALLGCLASLRGLALLCCRTLLRRLPLLCPVPNRIAVDCVPPNLIAA